jgi:tRNA dimethylallyltransferase
MKSLRFGIRPPMRQRSIRPPIRSGRPTARPRPASPPSVRQASHGPPAVAPADVPHLLVIFGPTSSGKTALSLDLAKRLPVELGLEVEIVGADSRQVYVGMDIGTGKVDRSVMRRVPHHALDMRPPDRMVSLVDYQALAIQRIGEIHARGRLPILVGGTGSYVLSVIENWIVGDDLHAGEENFRARGKGPPLFRTAVVRPAGTAGSLSAREALERRIDQAVEGMFKAGLVEEVVGLAERYRLWETPRLQRNALARTHGYREFLELAHARTPVRFRYKESELAWIKTAIQEHTRDYARRQWSWLKKMPAVQPVEGVEAAIRVVRKLME